MADIKPIITVDTGESQKSVKQLKKEISDLKDRILNLTKGTEEYTEAVEKLQADQRQLDEVMSLTKKTATALDGSYDALTHQMSLLKKEWRATADEARRADLGAQIDEINGKLKEMDASVGNFQRNVGNYVSHWEGMPEVTKDFGAAMAEMNQQIEPTKQKFESVSKIASGLAGGMAAVQGITALLGTENKNLAETFIKLQAAMAIAQGVGALGGLVEGLGKARVAFAELATSIKAVNIALGATGWIAVITAAVSAIILITEHLKKEREEIDWLNDSLDKLDGRNKSLLASDKEMGAQLERDIKLMAAQGASEKEILEKRLEYTNLYYEAAKRNKNEAFKQYQGAKNDLDMGIGNVTQEDVDKAEQLYNAANEVYREYLNKRLDILNDMKIAELNAKKKTEVKEPEVVLPDINIDENTKVDTTSFVSNEGSVYKKKASMMAGVEKTYADIARKNAEELADYEVTIEERKLARLKELYQEAIDAKDYTSEFKLKEDIANQEIALEEAKNQAIIESDKKRKEKQIEMINEVSNSLAAAGSITEGILQITQAAAEADGEISEKEAKRIKGMQYATASINMLQGAITAFSTAQSLGPILGPIIGGVNAGAVIAMGTANLMKIKNTDIKGSVSSGAVGAVTPNSNVFGTDIPFAYTRQLTGASEIDTINEPIKVYVTESDITDAVNHNKARIEEASF